MGRAEGADAGGLLVVGGTCDARTPEPDAPGVTEGVNRLGPGGT